MFAAHAYSAQLVTLLGRYIKGEIEESLWKRFLSMLDHTEARSQERMALIAFMNDFLLDRNFQVTNLFAEDRTLQPCAA